MSGKSKNSEADKRAHEKYLARPFDPTILAQAKQIAGEYEIVMWFEDGLWFGRGLELPHTYGDGKTPAACIASVRQGLVLTVATMLEDGDRPPAASRTGERTEQVNIRLTAGKKVLLEGRSRSAGFKGLADYVRASVLAESAKAR